MRLLVPLTLVCVLALAAVGGWAWQRGAGATSASAAPKGQPSGAARPTSPPLVVDVHVVATEPFEVTVPATGALLARESVELVSELSRRLVRIRAEEGSKVKKGAVLFELDTADLQAELKRLDVQIRLAKTNTERQKALLAEGLTTRREFDTAEAELDGLNAQRGSLFVTLSRSTIRAPFAGTMGLRHVSEGAWVSPSTVLAALHDTSTLKLDFTLPERYASAVVPGRDFRFEVSGRPEVLKGKILAFEPNVEASSRSVLVRGVVENTGSDLLPGTFATVELPVRVDQAMLIPPIAVIPGADGSRVFVVRDGVVRSVLVDLGARTKDRVQVLAGLAPGDQVAMSNLLRVRDGARVKVQPKAASPASVEPAP